MFKTTDAQSPAEYIDRLEEPRRAEIRKLDELIRQTAPHLEPHIMSGMLAYGRYHYRGRSGREGDWFIIGLAAQKRYISLYVSAASADGYLAESYKDLLPKADIGRSCVRIKRIADVDVDILTRLIREGASSTGVSSAG